MKGYKGFSKGLVCQGKQYAENTVFEEDDAKICESGMHFCENPFDVLDYYGFVADNGELNEYAEVEALDDAHTDDQQKFCTKKLKVGAKLGIAGLVNAFVNFTLDKTKRNGVATNTGDRSAATNTGYCSAATNTGKNGFAISTGIEGKAKGALGCYIAVAEWTLDKFNDRYKLVGFKAHKVDGKTIKPDTFYALKNGKFVAVK